MKLHTFKGEFPIEIETQKKKLYRMKKVKVSDGNPGVGAPSSPGAPTP